jgi:hypothetical protein
MIHKLRIKTCRLPEMLQFYFELRVCGTEICSSQPCTAKFSRLLIQNYQKFALFYNPSILAFQAEYLMKWYNTIRINAAYSPIMFKLTVVYHVPPALEHAKLIRQRNPRIQNRKYQIPLRDMSLKSHLNIKVRIKGKVHPRTGHEGPERE